MGNCIDKNQQAKAISEQQMAPIPFSKKENSSFNSNNPLSHIDHSSEMNYKKNGVISRVEDFRISSNDFVGHKKTSIYDDYSILGTSLGTGSFGEVRKAIHRPTNIIRAIKTISKDSGDPEEQKKLMNEVKMLKKLVLLFPLRKTTPSVDKGKQDHPNIIQIVDSYEEETRFFIVTELCTGGELYEKIKLSKFLTDKEAANIMHQILSAVNYCHGINIVHRDLKPENILYESNKPNAKLKVIDFGTSRVFKPNQKMNRRHGTPFYVAPEVLNGIYDYKCDIWSCGVILYILLSGRPPFYAPTESGILNLVQKGQYSFSNKIWDEVSSDAKDLISKMMCLDPNQRITAAEALQHCWFTKMLSNETIAKPVAEKVLRNLSKFSCKQKIQEGVFVLLVNTMMTQEEKTVLTEVFKSLDSNGDGKLSYSELVEGYTKILEDEEAAKATVETVMKKTDQNDSGMVDYSGIPIDPVSPF